MNKYIKSFLLATLLLMLTGATLKEKAVDNTKGEIIYVFDPLCSWCYGFGPVIKQLNETYGNDFHFSIMSGGMVTGETVKPMSENAEFIRPALEGITDYTGVEFGEAFFKNILEKSSYVGNSLPPTKALCILKEHAPAKCIEIGHEIQQLLYLHGKDVNKPESYYDLAVKYGMTKEDFLKKFNEEHYTHKAQHEFSWAAKHELYSFPTVIYKHGTEAKFLTQGYDTYKSLSSKLEKIKKEHQKALEKEQK